MPLSIKIKFYWTFLIKNKSTVTTKLSNQILQQKPSSIDQVIIQGTKSHQVKVQIINLSVASGINLKKLSTLKFKEKFHPQKKPTEIFSTHKN